MSQNLTFIIVHNQIIKKCIMLCLRWRGLLSLTGLFGVLVKPGSKIEPSTAAMDLSVIRRIGYLYVTQYF